MKKYKKLLIDLWYGACVACVFYRLGAGHGPWLPYTAIIWLPPAVGLLLYLASHFITQWRQNRAE